MTETAAPPDHIINVQETPNLVTEASDLAENPPMLDIQEAQLLSSIRHVIADGGRRFTIWAGGLGVRLQVTSIFVPPDYKPPEG